MQTWKAEAFTAAEWWPSPCARSSKGWTGGWVTVSAGFGHRWLQFLALSFDLVPFSLFPWGSSFPSLAGSIGSRAHAELMPFSFSPLGWSVPFSSFEKQTLFLEPFVVLQQIGWREELKTAARSYGQRLSLAVGSGLSRQRRRRAPSFHRIPLPGGDAPSCQASHVSVGRGSGNRFSLH